jgi:hypothetical protein
VLSLKGADVKHVVAALKIAAESYDGGGVGAVGNAKGMSTAAVYSELTRVLHEIQAAHVGVLLTPYMLDCYWFEVLECARKVCLLGLPALLVSDSLGQLIVGLIVVFVAQSVFMWRKPYRDPSDNTLQMICQMVVFFALLSKMVFGAVDVITSEQEAALCVLLIVLVCVPVAFIALQALTADLDEEVEGEPDPQAAALKAEIEREARRMGGQAFTSTKRLGALGKSSKVLGKSGRALGKSLRNLTGACDASATLDVIDVSADDTDNSWAMPVARRLVAEETRARDAHIAQLQAELANAQSEAKEQTLLRANTERQINQLIAPPGDRRAAAAGFSKGRTGAFMNIDTSAKPLWTPEVSPENSLARGRTRVVTPEGQRRRSADGVAEVLHSQACKGLTRERTLSEFSPTKLKHSLSQRSMDSDFDRGRIHLGAGRCQTADLHDTTTGTQCTMSSVSDFTHDAPEPPAPAPWSVPRTEEKPKPVVKFQDGVHFHDDTAAPQLEVAAIPTPKPEVLPPRRAAAAAGRSHMVTLSTSDGDSTVLPPPRGPSGRLPVVQGSRLDLGAPGGLERQATSGRASPDKKDDKARMTRQPTLAVW